MTKIACIGLGIMGAGMARNLLEAGYDLAVYNRTVAKAQPLVRAGATLATTPREAAMEADVIITIVGDDDSSRKVWLGEDGVLAGRPNPNALAIESTTVSLGWVRELHHTVTRAGLRFIDCPVTGGRRGAESGTLTLLVGAEADTLDAARPILESYSQEIIHFGPPETGTAYKLVVNLMGSVQMAALAEGLLLAEKAGLDMERVVEGLTSGAVASPLVKGWAARTTQREYDEVNFSAKWMHKDADYGLKMAREVGQPMPLSAVSPQLYQLAINQGLGEKNFSAIAEALRGD